ncbi:MAG: nucleotide pyrophosphohydrolase [Bacteroidales bacterium]|jgi:NTP pyrophosphatase (non-canonical NTP hydrolase)|nr:nucleotide pyrophosphohydrolase [Bacteroidales bacterium]
MTLAEAQEKVDVWINKYGVRYFNELTNMTLLTEEVGELARIMARKYGEQTFKDSDKEKNLSEELADIFFVLICIANQTNVNLEKAFIESIEKKTKRDKTRHIENKKLR